MVADDDRTGQVLLIDKPVNLSSFGVVARVRRVLSEKAGRKVKVGHTGTLDPFATGLMILLTDKKCREAGQFSKLDKVYQAEIRFGQTSSTGDPEGEIVQSSSRQPELDEINAVLGRFVGQITQTPPAFSAIKVDGQRAYKLARQGKTVEMPSREVEIHSIKLVRYDYPYLEIEAHVSSGTYIRTLAEDIGQALGVGAYCSSLSRLKVGEYSIGQAISLSDMGVNS